MMMTRNDGRLAWIVLIAVLPLAFAFCETALATSLSDLPIGHLKVTVGDGGLINVEARCVPTKDIINEIAQKTGKTVVYDCDVKTYGSVYQSVEQWKAPKWWVSKENTAPGVSIREDGNVWHVKASYSPESRKYDAALTEAQIVDSCTTSIHPVLLTEATEGALDTGILIYNGHYVPGPYKVETTADNSGRMNVQINGLVVESLDTTPPESPEPPSSLPDSGQFDDRVKLGMYLSYVLLPQMVDEYGPDVAPQKIRDFLKTQSIVGRILTPEESSDYPYPNNIWIEFADHPGAPVNAIIGGIDMQTGKPSEDNVPMSSFTVDENVQSMLRVYNKYLGRSGVLICGKNQIVIDIVNLDNLKRFPDAVASENTMSILQTECLIHEIVPERPIARLMAVNLRENADALVNRLQRMLSDREEERIKARAIPAASQQ